MSTDMDGQVLQDETQQAVEQTVRSGSKKGGTAKPKQQPAEIEATEPDTVVIEYGGHHYVFPASLDDADGDVIDAVDDQKISYVLRSLMSEQQWKTFKATKPKVRDYNALFDVYAKKIGLESAEK